ncbi:ATP-binding protein [Cellulosilyticum ruminicola]|uniref:ATP-binding protein n=1 Tax=Cellulosilyticum ruminicola TaxID=425254 RepID=UPI0006D299D9|nr:ATP-binding protein [Cellulosilyticum ruminicola]
MLTKEIYKTGYSVVDAILRQKSMAYDNEQIQLRVNLDLNSCGFIEDKDLCSIFANAIDNAIESCEKINSEGIKKYIYMESQITQDFLVIKIRNSKEHMNKWCNNQLITQKKDKKLHGLGIKNIKRALDRYNGEYIIKEGMNDFRFKLVITINVKM